MFIWQAVTGVDTNSYHDSGGLAVVAETLEQAREFLSKHPGIRVESPNDDRYPNDRRCGAFDQEPDFIYDLAPRPTLDLAPNVIVFPDGGCC